MTTGRLTVARVMNILAAAGACAIATMLLLRADIVTGLIDRPAKIELTRAALEEIADGGRAIGESLPAVRLIAFLDYGCGWCKQYDSVLEVIGQRYPEHLAIVYKDFVLDTLSPVLDVHIAARCAGDQGRFLEFHRAVFREQAYVADRNGWMQIASSIDGLDLAMLRTCVLSDAHRAEVLRGTRQARQLGFTMTPSSVIGYSLVTGSLPLLAADSIVASEIRSVTRRQRP